MSIFKRSGGYRKLHSYNFATIIHLATIKFCRKFIPWQQDELGKTVGQMIGAARSGRSNIAEGSERAATSTETEIKLTDVARASLAELQTDLELYLAEHASIPWSVNSENHRQLSAINLETFEHTKDLLHDYWVYLHGQRRKFDRWLANDDPLVVANALIVLIQRTTGMLSRQMEHLGEAFVQQGGIRERMRAARVENVAQQQGAPNCPLCEKPMRRRMSGKGAFWGCSSYPSCRGTREIEGEG